MSTLSVDTSSSGSSRSPRRRRLQPAGDGALGDALASAGMSPTCPRRTAGRPTRRRLLCGGGARRLGSALLRRLRPVRAGVLRRPPPMTASSAPTSTVSSSATRILVSTPAAGDGISVSTLSVDTSSSGSSASTCSPSCFSQRVTVPSVTLSPSGGHGDGYRHRSGSSQAWRIGRRTVSRARAGACRREPGAPRRAPRTGSGAAWMSCATSSGSASQL